VHLFYIPLATVASECVILAVFFITKSQQIMQKTKLWIGSHNISLLHI